MSDAAPLKELSQRLKKNNRQIVCNELGISQQYLSDILLGRRGISEAVGKKLGFERTWKRLTPGARKEG